MNKKTGSLRTRHQTDNLECSLFKIYSSCLRKQRLPTVLEAPHLPATFFDMHTDPVIRCVVWAYLAVVGLFSGWGQIGIFHLGMRAVSVAYNLNAEIN